MTHHWLFKSEPNTFSIDDLANRPGQKEPWNGVRNYQARNMLKNDIKAGDLGFFYHSSCDEPGIYGVVEVVRSGYPDHTAFDPESPYFDPKSTTAHPRWYMVDVKLRQRFKTPLLLKELKTISALHEMVILRRGNRLSVTPVTAAEWKTIEKWAKTHV